VDRIGRRRAAGLNPRFAVAGWADIDPENASRRCTAPAAVVVLRGFGGMEGSERCAG